jgi:predicted nucleotidyltransferase component of viral defense system
MLHQNAVTPAALGLLKKISAYSWLNAFGLGGGTNVALRKGHRLSVDLDFFSNTAFDADELFHLLTHEFPSAELLFRKNQTMIFNIDETKVDFVLYPFPWLQPFEQGENIRLLHLQDLIPMKLQAVSNRNAKKDYWDLAILLDEYPLSAMIGFFKSKFPNIDTGFIIHSLTDFDKAEKDIDPDTFINITWDEVKQKLSREVKKYTLDLL